MSRLNTCDEHDDAIVVWDGRGGCTLCAATTQIDALKDRAKELEDQLDAAREIADDLHGEMKEQMERLAGNG